MTTAVPGPDDDSIDLGRSKFLPAGWRLRTTRIVGARLNQFRSQVRMLAPGEPGVYAMINADGEIIYVGKAKNLRKRLFCYVRSKGRDRKAAKILARTRTIVWEALPSEFTALLRELELIRRWRPRWNVQGQPLRRRNAYICLGHRPAPFLTLTRKSLRHLVARFGPVPATRKTRDVVRWLNDAFQLRDCPPGPVELHPPVGGLFPVVPPSGCLRMELGHCLGPCTPEATPAVYRERVRAAQAFLEGRDRSLLDSLAALMTDAAAGQRFETAALLRDKLTAIRTVVDRLERLRVAQRTLSFVYPVFTGEGVLWYLVHGARVLGCVSRPSDAPSAEAALVQLRRVFGAGNAELLLDAYEPIDGMVLVMTWFRKSRGKRLTPAAAIRHAESCLASAEG